MVTKPVGDVVQHRLRNKAYQRAMRELARRHPEEYRKICLDELIRAYAEAQPGEMKGPYPAAVSTAASSSEMV